MTIPDHITETLQHLRLPVWVFDVEDMRVLWANHAGLNFWEADNLEQLRARDMQTGMSTAVRNRLKQAQAECHEHGQAVSNQWTVYPNGKAHSAEAVMSPLMLPGGREVLLVHLLYERTDADSMSLHSTQALLHTSAMISLYDQNLELLYANPAARAVSLKPDQPLRDRLVNAADMDRIMQSIRRSGECEIEVEVRTRAGRTWHHMVIEETTSPATGEKSILVSATDVNSKRQAQRKAYQLAYTDSLTGLSNRIALVEYMRKLCERADEVFAVLFLDLDRFKLVNDSLGHTVGDHLLKAVSRRLMEGVYGKPAFLGRLGGDEFIIVLEGITNVETLREFADCLLTRMSRPYEVAGHRLNITPSIGVCRFPEDGDSTSMLMRHADLAMYAAKANKDGVSFYHPDMNEDNEQRLRIENELVDAVRLAQFELHYQPRVCATTQHTIGMEALVRWRHPERGLISPATFIPVAEETGLIVPIGRFVLKEAMAQQRQWAQEGHDIHVSINISPVQFSSRDFLDIVFELQQSTGCDPSRVELEITESMLVGDSTPICDILEALSARQFRLAIDDFGTGYSNLAYLQRYPLTNLKIDRSFIEDIHQMAIPLMILQMGKLLELGVVAEGVETAEQVEWLVDHGCDELQGYYFSRPLDIEAASEHLRENRRKLMSDTKAA